LYLIGAGPGDPELLTLKAARVLRECDVILYDRLVHPATVGLARADSECIYVGKHQGEQELRQEQIFDLIRDRALQGKTVGRLKGGDSLVFGRGAEEWQLALKHGIRVELIPGVSSAIAVPGLAGIPLTFRNLSQSFAVITGHSQEGTSHAWDRYAGVDTLVILMGVKNRQSIAAALIAAGRPSRESAAFVYRGSLKEEQTVETTLAEVAAGNVHVKNPAVFVVGEVVNLRRLLKPSGA
jgi:uroporphyrin-III C-methyltransferase